MRPCRTQVDHAGVRPATLQRNDRGEGERGACLQLQKIDTTYREWITQGNTKGGPGLGWRAWVGWAGPAFSDAGVDASPPVSEKSPGPPSDRSGLCATPRMRRLICALIALGFPAVDACASLRARLPRRSPTRRAGVGRDSRRSLHHRPSSHPASTPRRSGRQSHEKS